MKENWLDVQQVSRLRFNTGGFLRHFENRIRWRTPKLQPAKTVLNLVRKGVSRQGHASKPVRF
jgi:hypothetical protein